MPLGSELPRWSLGSIYRSLEAPEFRRDKELLEKRGAALLALLEDPIPEDADGAAARILALLRAYEEAGDLAENLEAYASAIYTTDTRNAAATAEINAIEALSLPLAKAAVLLRSRLAARSALVSSLAAEREEIAPYAFFLAEAVARAERQMDAELEDLAADLARSGADAWSRLQEAVSSTASAPWDSGDTSPGAGGADARCGGRKTVIALRDLAHDTDRSVRERAYRAELEAWKTMELPLAAALNGVKGAAGSLDRRRGWKTPLEKAAFQSRISEDTLASLVSVMEESLPLFRRYLAAKARLLGIGQCAFYDLFAPVGASKRKWDWEESRDFIVDRFSEFDPAMGNFARHAYALSWIDALGREGKIGGAYCTDLPLSGESRILCNFEGSFSSVSTVAHELGHAWHHEVIKDLPRTLTAYPMTLAETASTFAETVVLEGALGRASAEERLGLIEGSLKDSCQVLVDILSRFYFERALFERRETAELSPQELCGLMTEAQMATYGDGLDSQALHPYMWAVKGHYYRAGLAFYNYPYAFGLLFALGLYARAKAEGPSFAGAYRELLRLTGRASAEEVARSAGFDIQGADFWRSGVAVIAARIDEFESLIKESI